MTESMLKGCTILVVEDEYLLADDLCTHLANDGATVVGPAPTLAQGRALLDVSERLDAAVLDVSLRGEPVFELADELAARNLPFLFTTGYDASAIPERFCQITRCEKPVRMPDVVKAIARLTHA